MDLEKPLSAQRCDSCRGFLKGVDVSPGGARPVHRRKTFRAFFRYHADEVWQDGEEPVPSLHRRWPRLFKYGVWGATAVLLAGFTWAAWRKWQQYTGSPLEAVGMVREFAIDPRRTEGWRLRAVEAARRAIAASTVEELLPLIERPGVSEEAIRRHHAEREPLPLGSDLDERYILPPAAEAGNAVCFLYRDTAGRPRAMIVTERDGGMKIDWPALVGHGQVSVEEFASTMPRDEKVLRVRARLGHYYNGPFSDDQRWLSVRLADVTDEQVVFGYVERGTVLAEALERTLPDPLARDARGDLPLTVRMASVSDKPAGLAKLSSVVAWTWYLPRGLDSAIAEAAPAASSVTGAGESPPPP